MHARLHLSFVLTHIQAGRALSFLTRGTKEGTLLQAKKKNSSSLLFLNTKEERREEKRIQLVPFVCALK